MTIYNENTVPRKVKSEKTLKDWSPILNVKWIMNTNNNRTKNLFDF